LADQPDRSARFISIICLYDPETQEHQFFEGVVTGQIAAEEAGRDGFGYDPLFIPDGYDQTFGQLGDQVKNTISHRRRALIKLHNYLLAETS
jgi:XTP/dITP diphosphohydrolase